VVPELFQIFAGFFKVTLPGRTKKVQVASVNNERRFAFTARWEDLLRAMSSYMWLRRERNGIARVTHARTSTLAACANTHCSNMASRLARNTRGRVEQRRVVHVFRWLMVRAEARWWLGCLRHEGRGTCWSVGSVNPCDGSGCWSAGGWDAAGMKAGLRIGRWLMVCWLMEWFLTVLVRQG